MCFYNAIEHLRNILENMCYFLLPHLLTSIEFNHSME